MAPYAHERRIQRFAYLALGVAVAITVLLAGREATTVFGIGVPSALGLGIAVVGGATGIVAVHRRNAVLGLVTAIILAVAALLASSPRPGIGAYAVGLLLGAATLAFAELVHTTHRYERAHRVVEREHVPEEHLNRVTDETLKTLATRLSAATGLVAIAVALAYALRGIGPRQWRDAIETTAPVGVALLALTLFGALGIYILSRGAQWRRSTEPSPGESNDAPP